MDISPLDWASYVLIYVPGVSFSGQAPQWRAQLYHLIASLSVMEGCHQVILPLKHLLQAEQALFPHLCKGCMLQFPTVLVTLHWIDSSHSMSVLNRAGRKRGDGVEISKQYSRWVLTSADKKGEWNTSISVLSNTVQDAVSFPCCQGHCKTPHLSTELQTNLPIPCPPLMTRVAQFHGKASPFLMCL